MNNAKHSKYWRIATVVLTLALSIRATASFCGWWISDELYQEKGYLQDIPNAPQCSCQCEGANSWMEVVDDYYRDNCSPCPEFFPIQCQEKTIDSHNVRIPLMYHVFNHCSSDGLCVWDDVPMLGDFDVLECWEISNICHEIALISKPFFVPSQGALQTAAAR